MGKRIISQARGHGGPAYRVPKQAFIYKIKYPQHVGAATVINIIHSTAHSAPLMKIKGGNEIFYIPATNGIFVGQEITIGSGITPGSIIYLRDAVTTQQVYNIELNPGDGGKMIRTAGSSAIVNKKLDHNKIAILMPNKKEVIVSGDCRATLGVIAGDGRINKPFVKAGNMFYKMKARNKLWPRTSAVKMNAIDHPFGSGRGKRIKPKIAKRNAPPGARVGHIRPSRTGRRK
ncbi:50S ribosomal protein L2 [Candidatus Pacearchaeota archaeon]|nr:50S ribosomal protein L2 [Candidatus Pacearchaeota archaeon]